MPLYTQHYGMAAFGSGDIYSSSLDQRRMTIIDNHLAFLSEQVGPGVIDGWTITDNQDGSITVSMGMGMIDRLSVSSQAPIGTEVGRIHLSHGDFEIDLDANSTKYLFMKAKTENGGVSGNSNIESVVAIDTMPPNDPTGLTQVSSLISYLASLSSYDEDLLLYLRNLLGLGEEDDDIELISYSQLAFKWDANTDIDFSHYKINKWNGSEYEAIATTTEVIFVDVDLEQDTTYTYEVIAVDLSGNESNGTQIDVSTSQDTRIPVLPTFLQAFPSNESLQVIWDNSPSDNVASYRVVLQPLDNYYEDDGVATETTITARSDDTLNSTFAIFENLENNRKYRVTVYPVSTASIEPSEGISTVVEIEYLAGAGEINGISAEFPVSTFEDIGIEGDLSWRYKQDDPYLPYADKFYVTFIENGTRWGEPIEILETAYRTSCVGGNDDGYCYNLTVKYLPYNEDGFIRYESIKEYTPYVILIQTVDEDGNISNGVIERIERTPISDPVESISDFTIERQTDNSQKLTWSNPIESYFAYNTITITYVDLASPAYNPSAEEGTSYVERIKIGKADSYSISPSIFNVNYRYNITITSYDVFDNEGSEYVTYKQYLEEEDNLLPSEPESLFISAGDTQVILQWSYPPDEVPNLEYYKIYRAVFTYYVEPDSFSNIATVPATNTSFIDYTVTNGTSYTYYITAVDIYGNESLNTDDNQYFPSFLMSTTPRKMAGLDPPENLIVTASSNMADAYLTWDTTSGAFDGYQILRSDGNNYTFEIVGTVPVSENTYIDEDALLVDGRSYYYMVRKYKNDVSLYTSTSNVAPSESVFIGSVTTTNGTSTVTIDTSEVRDILNFEAPITEMTERLIAVHNHKNENGIDKRIELRSNVLIQDWTTLDYKTYTTTQDIEGATNYLLTITGTLNEDYFEIAEGQVDQARLALAQAGSSPVLYEIDDAAGKIVFNEPLYTTCTTAGTTQLYAVECPVMPYSTPPTLSLELIDISEVTNYLPSDRVGDLSATQVTSGQIATGQMPSVYHEGRVGERLIPLRLPMYTLTNFVYSLSATYEGDRNNMGSAVTFYDMIRTTGESQILAATSNGVWLSNDYGTSWSQVKTFDTAVHRVYQSQAGTYYAITNYGVYISEGTSFRTWTKMGGLHYVKAIRDITEDSSGNLYISTDLGVFRLNSEDVPFIEDNWEKLPIFGPRSSEAYGVLYDGDYTSSAGEGRLLVSNELGLLESTDEGRSWQYITELETQIKVRRFYQTNTHIFALADTAIYRQEKGTATFVKVADLSTSKTRQMEIYNDQIYITSNLGPLRSSSDDIYTDSDISFTVIWPEINVNNYRVVVTSLKAIDGTLFVGTDRRMFIMDSDEKLWIQYEQKNTVVPTIFVDSQIQQLGVFYNNGGSAQNISFDEAQGVEAIVEVSNVYDIFYAEFGGWAHNNYSAKCKVYENSQLFAETPDEVPLDKNPFSIVTLPSYTDDNAHKEKADTYKTAVQSDLSLITGSATPTGDDLVELIAKTYNDFELFLSQLYESAREDFVLPSLNVSFVNQRTVISNQGEETTSEVGVYYDINQEKGTEYTAYVNTVNGMFSFDVPFDRYDFLTTDLIGVTVANAGELTHREVEDSFEYAYSGLPSQLSQVQQVNLVKTGIFIEKTWPNQMANYVTLVQQNHIIPADGNWFDTLNSTVNYTLEIGGDDSTLALSYPSEVFYLSGTGKIFVGGQGGVLTIDTTTLEISEVNIDIGATEIVRDIIQVRSDLYLITEQSVFISENNGVTWSEYNKSGLPNRFYAIGFVANNLVVGGSDGVYTKTSESETSAWEQVVTSTHPVTVMLSSNILFAVINGTIQTTANGYSFTDSTLGSTLDVTSIARYGYTNTYVSSVQGLYSDSGSFNSLTPRLEEIDLSDLIGSTETINHVQTNNTDTVAVAISDGSYGIIQDNMLRVKENTSLSTVHKILVIGSDVWLFGGDLFKAPSLDYPIKLSAGAPV